MEITLIAAVAQNRAIGYQNKLLYWLPNDLKRFKALTSLPKGALPNRRNIVLSHTTGELPGCEVFRSFDEALAHCASDEHIYIIGGASVYRQTIDKADRLALTLIEDTPAQADAFFPDYSDWKVVHQENHEADERHAHAYKFVDLERLKK